MNKSLKIAEIGKECVACGSCLPVCPKNAVCIDAGITAKIDAEKCIGCGKCARTCPAAVISVVERRLAV